MYHLIPGYKPKHALDEKTDLSTRLISKTALVLEYSRFKFDYKITINSLLCAQISCMSEFQLYLKLGIEHIADIQSFDHILFIISLCVVYPIKNWNKVLILVTAFTIGHSLTLALATLKIIHVDTKLIEFLIPATILITASGNLFQKSDKFNSKLHVLSIWQPYFSG